MFDVTRQSSFSNMKKWIEELRNHADPHIVAMLVGNKSDLTGLRVVPVEVAEAFACAFSHTRLFSMNPKRRR
jgi:GTPase SAR1 family protein